MTNLKHFVFILFCYLIPCLCNAQEERVDTIYYDSSWNVVSNRLFADYYRIALYPSTNSRSKLFRDYYIDGTLYAKGSFISLDRENDKNSIFDKTIERFYKSGNTLSIESYASGMLEGESIEYNENGLITRIRNYREGKLDGTSTEFAPDGSYKQIQYKGGQSVHPYYVYGSTTGSVMKLMLSDNSVFWENPSVSEKKNVYKDGRQWIVYSKNGITIGQALSISDAYGSWYKVELQITNESLNPIVFEPVEDIRAYSLDRDLRPSILNVVSSDQYIAKVSRHQSWSAFAVGLAEAVNSANAGYSTSTSKTNVNVSGYGSSYASASVRGSGGSAHASVSENSSFSGYGQATTITKAYDGAAAYQARVLSQDRMDSFNETLWAGRKALERGYLKKNTVNVGETISGYVLVEKGNCSSLIYSIFIEGAEYKNSWIINEDLKQKYDDSVDYLDDYVNVQMDEIEELMNHNKTNKAGIKLNDLLSWFKIRHTYTNATVNRFESLQEKCKPVERQRFKDPVYGY